MRCSSIRTTWTVSRRRSSARSRCRPTSSVDGCGRCGASSRATTSSSGRPTSSKGSRAWRRRRPSSAVRRYRSPRHPFASSASRSRSAMPDTELELAEDVRRQAKGRHLVVLLDFDGTLCEFEADPAAVQLPEARRQAIARIQERATVAIVSGRRMEDVRARCALTGGAIVAGLHGLEIDGLDERYVHPDLENASAAVAEVSEALRKVAAGIHGACVEDEGASVWL